MVPEVEFVELLELELFGVLVLRGWLCGATGGVMGGWGVKPVPVGWVEFGSWLGVFNGVLGDCGVKPVPVGEV